MGTPAVSESSFSMSGTFGLKVFSNYLGAASIRLNLGKGRPYALPTLLKPVISCALEKRLLFKVKFYFVAVYLSKIFNDMFYPNGIIVSVR